MAAIKLAERELQARSNTLHVLFAALRDGKPRVAVGFGKGAPGGATVLVAKDGQQSAKPYRDESFRTSVETIRCRYFELWRSSGDNFVILDRAYFTLLEVVPEDREFRDVLCIHTDPADVNDLKQGPHLHMTCAPGPVSHCHFPLEFGFLNAVLKDCDSLTAAMQRAISVVAIDVLPAYRDR